MVIESILYFGKFESFNDMTSYTDCEYQCLIHHECLSYSFWVNTCLIYSYIDMERIESGAISGKSIHIKTMKSLL